MNTFIFTWVSDHLAFALSLSRCIVHNYIFILLMGERSNTDFSLEGRWNTFFHPARSGDVIIVPYYRYDRSAWETFGLIENYGLWRSCESLRAIEPDFLLWAFICVDEEVTY